MAPMIPNDVWTKIAVVDAVVDAVMRAWPRFGSGNHVQTDFRSRASELLSEDETRAFLETGIGRALFG
jgi:hypothetical protein